MLGAHAGKPLFAGQRARDLGRRNTEAKPLAQGLRVLGHEQPLASSVATSTGRFSLRPFEEQLHRPWRRDIEIDRPHRPQVARACPRAATGVHAVHRHAEAPQAASDAKPAVEHLQNDSRRRAIHATKQSEWMPRR